MKTMKHLLTSATVALLLLFGVTAVVQADSTRSTFFHGLFTPASGSRALPFKSFLLILDEDSGVIVGVLSGRPPSRIRTPEPSEFFSGMANRRGSFTASFEYGDRTYTLTGVLNKSTGTVTAVIRLQGNPRVLGVIFGTRLRNII